MTRKCRASRFRGYHTNRNPKDLLARARQLSINQLLDIPGASVSDVTITGADVEVRVRLRARTLTCECGYSTHATYDRARRRWRHLDLVKRKLWLVHEIRRLDCPRCGVRTETVPWARPRARHTRDFEDTVLWLAQRTDRTSVATLMRCAWETVTAIIIRAVDEWIDEQRLEELYRIGVDEICYRHPNQYLTVIGNHDTGKVVGVEPGKSTASFTNFLDKQLDPTPNTVSVVSMDGSVAYRAAALERLPKAWICFDPFHVMQWTNRALDAVFSDSRTLRTKVPMSGGQWRGERWALRRGKERLTDAKREVVNLISRSDRNIGHAWRLKEDLRDILRIERGEGCAEGVAAVDTIGCAEQHSADDRVGAADRGSSQRYRGRDRTRRVERFDRGHQFEDPIDQCPWLRPSFSRSTDRDDLSDARWNVPESAVDHHRIAGLHVGQAGAMPAHRARCRADRPRGTGNAGRRRYG